LRLIHIGTVSAVLLTAAPVAAARETIAVFRDWAAFREDTGPSCFAVARPPPGTGADGTRAAALVSSFPDKRIRAQISVRLSRGHRDGAAITLTIGDRGFPLVPQGDTGWASDRREDAQIVAAMRSGSSMSVSTITPRGRPYADVYRLRGAASAIDAAMLACPLR
jgi:hypothetical protein